MPGEKETVSPQETSRREYAVVPNTNIVKIKNININERVTTLIRSKRNMW